MQLHGPLAEAGTAGESAGLAAIETGFNRSPWAAGFRHGPGSLLKDKMRQPKTVLVTTF